MRQSFLFRRLTLTYQLFLGVFGCVLLAAYLLGLPFEWLVLLGTAYALAFLPVIIAFVYALIDAARWLLSGMRHMPPTRSHMLIAIAVLLLSVVVYVWAAPAIDPVHGRTLVVILAGLALGMAYSKALR